MKTVFLALLMAATLSAQGQVRKCTGPDGKITYSDFICGKDTANEKSVRTDANTIDSSGSRQDAQNYRADKDFEQAKQSGSKQCTFASYKNGDEKWKVLAEAAEKECFANLTAKKSGGRTTLDAYAMWKDHHDLVTSKRYSGASNKTTNCQPNGFGGLRCQ